MIDETLQSSYTIEDIQDQLFQVHDIIHAWPKSLKNARDYQRIASLFDPISFWKFADPWEVTICVHRETHRCEYLLPEYQCLLLKQHIEDTYGITLPSMPNSFNLELWSGKWDLTLKQVNSEPEFSVYVRLAKTATRSLKTAQKLARTAATRDRQLEMAKEKFTEAQSYGAKFVSIDIECYEMDHKCTTEVGISTMIVPEEKIESRHLLIREYSHLRNSRFVPDMSDAFGHGTSEWIHLRDCRRYISAAFRVDDGGRVFFIGHDPMADIKYLEKNLGCPFPKGMIVFDTRLMYSAHGGDAVLRNLAYCLDDLGIEFWNLHNAGNDAHYTLAAFKEMCLKGPKKNKKPEISLNECVPFVIRDIVPDDFLTAQNNLSTLSNPAETDGRMGVSEFLEGRTENTGKNISRVFEKRVRKAKQIKKSQIEEAVCEKPGEACNEKSNVICSTSSSQQFLVKVQAKKEGEKVGKDKPGTVNRGKVIDGEMSDESSIHTPGRHETSKGDFVEMNIGPKMKAEDTNLIDLGKAVLYGTQK